MAPWMLCLNPPPGLEAPRLTHGVPVASRALAWPSEGVDTGRACVAAEVLKMERIDSTKDWGGACGCASSLPVLPLRTDRLRTDVFGP